MVNNKSAAISSEQTVPPICF